MKNMKLIDAAKLHESKIIPAILVAAGFLFFGPAIASMPGLFGPGYESLHAGIHGRGSILDHILGSLWLNGSIDAAAIRSLILLLHILNAVVVARIAHRVSATAQAFWVSLLAGLVFLLAPMQINTIAFTDQLSMAALVTVGLLLTSAVLEQQANSKQGFVVVATLIGAITIQAENFTGALSNRLKIIRSVAADASEAIPEAFFHPGAVNNPSEQVPIIGIALLVTALFLFSIISSRQAKKSSKAVLITVVPWTFAALLSLQSLQIDTKIFAHPATWYAFTVPGSMLIAWSMQHWQLRYLRVAFIPTVTKAMLSIGVVALFALGTLKNTEPFKIASTEAEKIVTIAAEETRVPESQVNYFTNIPFVVQDVPVFHTGLPQAIALTQAKTTKEIPVTTTSIHACTNDRQLGVIEVDGVDPTYSITAKEFPAHIKAQASDVDVLSWEGQVFSFHRIVNIEKARE